MYLGHVCEVLGGDTWEHLLQTRLLNPLCMTSTKILVTPYDVLTNHVAKPYIYKDGRFQDGTLNMYSIFPVEPAAAILSSGSDMTKWMRFLLNKGKLNDGTQLVNEKLLDDASKATTTTASDYFFTEEFYNKPTWPIEMTPIGYGHAFFVSTYRGYPRLWHDGSLLSYTSRIFIYPSRNIGVFVSTNGPGYMKRSNPHHPVKTIGYIASDGALGLEPWINLATTCTYPEPWRSNGINTTTSQYESNTVIIHPFKYTGYYKHPFLPGFHVFGNRNDNTKLTFEMNRVSGVLHSTPVQGTFEMENLHPFELSTDNTNQNKSTIICSRNACQITKIEVDYEVNVTYSKLLVYVHV